jgi:recombination protein RecA
MRLDVRRIESIKIGDEIIGNRTRVKLVKNKVAPPFKQAEFDIMYGRGISREGDVLDCAVEVRLIDKAGSWYNYKGERIGQGRENVKSYLAEHPEVLAELEQALKDRLKPQTIAPEVDEDGVIQED